MGRRGRWKRWLRMLEDALDLPGEEADDGFEEACRDLGVPEKRGEDDDLLA